MKKSLAGITANCIDHNITISKTKRMFLQTLVGRYMIVDAAGIGADAQGLGFAVPEYKGSMRCHKPRSNT